MTTLLTMLVASLLAASSQPQPVDTGALWRSATPFASFLESVEARREQWQSRFANAAIQPEALDRVRALPGRRRLLVIAVARCSDSAWAVPYLAKLAAAVPDKLDLRVIAPDEGGETIQALYPTPDDRQATPTVAVLDERDRLLGVWVERPGALQKWYIENKATVPTAERYRHLDAWYTDDGGRTTIAEVLAILERTTPAAAKAAEGN